MDLAEALIPGVSFLLGLALPPYQVAFTGYLAGGGTLSRSVTLDMICDGAGPQIDFERFAFDSSWGNLVLLTIEQFDAEGHAVFQPRYRQPGPADRPRALIRLRSWHLHWSQPGSFRRRRYTAGQRPLVSRQLAAPRARACVPPRAGDRSAARPAARIVACAADRRGCRNAASSFQRECT